MVDSNRQVHYGIGWGSVLYSQVLGLILQIGHFLANDRLLMNQKRVNFASLNTVTVSNDTKLTRWHFQWYAILCVHTLYNYRKWCIQGRIFGKKVEWAQKGEKCSKYHTNPQCTIKIYKDSDFSSDLAYFLTKVGGSSPCWGEGGWSPPAIE